MWAQIQQQKHSQTDQWSEGQLQFYFHYSPERCNSALLTPRLAHGGKGGGVLVIQSPGFESPFVEPDVARQMGREGPQFHEGRYPVCGLWKCKFNPSPLKKSLYVPFPHCAGSGRVTSGLGDLRPPLWGNSPPVFKARRVVSWVPGVENPRQHQDWLEPTASRMESCPRVHSVTETH